MANEDQVGNFTKIRRTREAYFSTPSDGNYLLTLYRESIIKENGVVIAASRDDDAIKVGLAEVQNVEVEFMGNTYNGNEIAGLIAAFFDKLDANRIAARAAAAAAPPVPAP